MLGHACVGGCVLPVSPLLLPWIFERQHGEEGAFAPFSVLHFPAVFSSLSALYRLLSQTSLVPHHLSHRPRCLPPLILKAFFCPSPHLLFLPPSCLLPSTTFLLEQLTPFHFLLPKQIHRCLQCPHSSFWQLQKRALGLSPSVPAVIGAAVSLLRSLIAAETQGGRQRRSIFSQNHSPAVSALCTQFSH